MNIKRFIPTRVLHRLEHDRQKLLFNERAVEYAYVFKWLHELRPLKVLDVGSGHTALPSLMRNCGSLVTAIDVKASNRHYHVIKDDITNTKLTEKFDLITCVSVLEHIPEFNKAVENMLGLLNPGGRLLMTFPYIENLYIPNVYALSGSNAYDKKIDYICQSFSRNEVRRWGDIVDQEYWRCWTGRYWTHHIQIKPVKVDRMEKHQLTCMLICIDS